MYVYINWSITALDVVSFCCPTERISILYVDLLPLELPPPISPLQLMTGHQSVLSVLSLFRGVSKS